MRGSGVYFSKWKGSYVSEISKTQDRRGVSQRLLIPFVDSQQRFTLSGNSEILILTVYLFRF